ncbi:MAG: shikimate dehydrogenase [Methylophilus sp.]
MTDKYAVIGHPIAHSKSPIIHQAFASQMGKMISYERVQAPLDGFAQTIARLIAEGYKGVNVTVPFKSEAFGIANQVASKAREASAANTLIFDAALGIVAANTDGVGLVRDIQQNLEVSLEGKRVLLIGAGGAAEGVAHPIAECAPKLFVVTNRSLDKAAAIVKKLEMVEDFKVTTIKCLDFKGLEGQVFDIVINATSAGLTDSKLPIPNSIFTKDTLAYDMMYGRETPFMAQARQAGASVADGLGMLVEQAAEAFYLWHGVRPETRPVIEKIRNS